MKIKTPIIIEEPGSLYLYNSVEDAERDLEYYDVDENVYRGWDSSGRVLNISSDEKNVNITLEEGSRYDNNVLKKVLRRYIKDVNKDIDIYKEDDLDYLLNQAKIFLYKPQTSWEIIRLFFSDLIKTLLSKPINR
jgi:ribosomal protein S20